MRVLVTGGTGFVGGHTVAALVGQGHQVRLLVRDRARIAPTLGPLGITDLDAVVGDITSAEAIEQAMRGCDAVVHAASVFSFDPRRAAAMTQTNRLGADTVLGAAQRQELDPIIYVSTFAVFLPTTTATLTASSPLGAGIGPYTHSKIAAEQVARDYQQAGAPVVITYPGAVLGPHDPYLGEGPRTVREVLRGRMPVLPRGRIPFVDARDVAALHAAALHPGQGPRRYLLTGLAMEISDLVALLGQLTGRRLPQRTAPDWLLLPVSRLVDRLQHVIPARLPVSAEQIAMSLDVGAGVLVDDTATSQELGVERRELRQTAADTVRWLAEQGQITPRQAGALAS